MNDLWLIAYGSGLQDGLNPCIFMTCAVFIAHGLWLNPVGRSPEGQAGIRHFSHIVWLRIIFVLVYALSFLEFNFGPAQIFLFHKNFILAAKIIYFALGVWAFILGVLFFKDWILLRGGPPADVPVSWSIGKYKILCLPPRNLGFSSDSREAEAEISCGKGQGVGRWGVCLTTVILSLVLSALAAVWPINNYVMLLGNEAFLKGQWQAVMPLLAGYVLFSMWPLWFVWVFLSVKNLRPSLLKIFCASIFFTASSSMIFIFK